MKHSVLFFSLLMACGSEELPAKSGGPNAVSACDFTCDGNTIASCEGEKVWECQSGACGACGGGTAACRSAEPVCDLQVISGAGATRVLYDGCGPYCNAVIRDGLIAVDFMLPGHGGVSLDFMLNQMMSGQTVPMTAESGQSVNVTWSYSALRTCTNIETGDRGLPPQPGEVTVVWNSERAEIELDGHLKCAEKWVPFKLSGIVRE